MSPRDGVSGSLSDNLKGVKGDGSLWLFFYYLLGDRPKVHHKTIYMGLLVGVCFKKASQKFLYELLVGKFKAGFLKNLMHNIVATSQAFAPRNVVM